VERARAERLIAWTEERRPPRRNRWLMAGRLRALAPDPPVHILAARAVQAIPAHGDRSHAEVLALVDELMDLGRRVPLGPGTRETPDRFLAVT
jgi:hypothetical protein